MSCRLVSHLTGSPNRITPARFLRGVWKLTASKSHPLTKHFLSWAALASTATRGTWLVPGLQSAPCAPLVPDIAMQHREKLLSYPAFSSSVAASWLYPLNLLLMDSSELTACHQLPPQLAWLALSSACCLYVNTGHCLPSIVGKPVVGGGCQKKKEGWISTAKPN